MLLCLFFLGEGDKGALASSLLLTSIHISSYKQLNIKITIINSRSVAQWSRAGSFDLGSGFDPRRSHLIRFAFGLTTNSGLNENLSRMAQEYRIVIQIVVPRLNVSKNIQETP